MVIIDESFRVIDKYLRVNGQDCLSALIITGGWIEGLYLGTSTLDKENPNTEMIKRIANQQASLTSLMDLLITYDDIEIIKIEQKLKVIQIAYDRLDMENIDSEIIFEIKDAASQVRAKIIR